MKGTRIDLNFKTPPTEQVSQGVAADGYSPVYSDMMIDFFLATPITREVTETLTWKNGDVREITKTVANPPPMDSEFARKIGIKYSKIRLWRKKYPEFNDACEECEAIVSEFIIKNGLAGLYPTQFAIFAGKNLTKMQDKRVNENRTMDMNKVLDQIEKGDIIDIYN